MAGAYNEIAIETLKRQQFNICRSLDTFPRQSLILHFLLSRKHLNEAEMEVINAPDTRIPRITELLKCLRAKMTTAVFRDFLYALREYDIGNNPALAACILHSYEEAGGPQLQGLRPIPPPPKKNPAPSSVTQFVSEEATRPVETRAPCIPASGGRLSTRKYNRYSQVDGDVPDSVRPPEMMSAEEEIQPTMDGCLPPPLEFPVFISRDKKIGIVDEQNRIIIFNDNGTIARFIKIPEDIQSVDFIEALSRFSFVVCSKAAKQMKLIKCIQSTTNADTVSWRSLDGKEKEAPIVQAKIIPDSDGNAGLDGEPTFLHKVETGKTWLLIGTDNDLKCFKIEEGKFEVISSVGGCFKKICSSGPDSEVKVFAWNPSPDADSGGSRSFYFGSCDDEQCLEGSIDFGDDEEEAVLQCVFEPEGSTLYIVSSRSKLLRYNFRAESETPKCTSPMEHAKFDRLMYDNRKRCLVATTSDNILELKVSDSNEVDFIPLNWRIEGRQTPQRLHLLETDSGIKVIHFFGSKNYEIRYL